MDRYQGLRIFMKVAELESFSRAAEVLSLTKASVSNAIRDLEDLTAAMLLHRTTRVVRLTTDGQEFLEKCRDMLSDMDEIESMFRSDARQLTGKVRVDMPIPFARDVVLPKLGEFIQLYPAIDIEISVTDRRVDLLREGFDCVLRTGTFVDPDLVEKPIGRAKIISVAAPSYLAKYGKPKSIESLKGHKFIYFSQQLGNKLYGFDYFDGKFFREYKMPKGVVVNSAESLTAAALAGLGLAQLPLTTAKTYLKSGQLIQVLPKVQAESLEIKLVYPPQKMRSQRVRCFIEWLEPLIRQALE